MRLASIVTLRPAVAEDCLTLWRWRNDPETRRGSFDMGEVLLETHTRWFEDGLSRGDRRIYIVRANGVDVGMVRLDLKGREANVSINVAREWRGKGVGTEALRAVATEAFDRLGLVRLVAEVKPDNVASRVVFERAGFALVEERPVTSFVREVGREEVTSARRLEELWRGPFGLEYTDRNAGAGEKRARFWRNLLSELPVSSVLEVGCNLGANLRWIQPHVLPGKIVGVDVNDYALGRLKVGLPRVQAAAAVARELPFRDDAFDLVFTMGVLMHHAPDALPAAMGEIVRCARRYLLCGEYFAESLTEVFYRGQHGALFKQDFGARYQELFPELKLLKEGRLFEEDGWDDVTFWLFEKSRERVP